MKTLDKGAPEPSPLRRSARLAQARLPLGNSNLPRRSEDTAELPTAPQPSVQHRRSARLNISVPPTYHASTYRPTPPQDIPNSSANGRILRSSRDNIGQNSPRDPPQRAGSSLDRQTRSRTLSHPNLQSPTASRTNFNPARKSERLAPDTSSQQTLTRRTRSSVNQRCDIAVPEPPRSRQVRVSKPADSKAGTSSQSSSSSIAASEASTPSKLKPRRSRQVSVSKAADSKAGTSSQSSSSSIAASEASTTSKSKPRRSRRVSVSKPADSKAGTSSQSSSSSIAASEASTPSKSKPRRSRQVSVSKAADTKAGTSSQSSSSSIAASEASTPSESKPRRSRQVSVSKAADTKAGTSSQSSFSRIAASETWTPPVPEPPRYRKVSVSKAADTKAGTSSQSSSSEVAASEASSPSVPVARSAASTSTERATSTVNSVLSAMLKSQLSTKSAAGPSKCNGDKIVLVPLSKNGSLCMDFANGDSTTDTSAAAISDTDSSISSTLFAWSVDSFGSTNDTTHASSTRSGSDSILVGSDLQGDDTNEDTAEGESWTDEYFDVEDLTTDPSSLFSHVENQEELDYDEEDDTDNDDDTQSSLWTDLPGDFELDDLEEEEDKEEQIEDDKKKVKEKKK